MSQIAGKKEGEVGEWVGSSQGQDVTSLTPARLRCKGVRDPLHSRCFYSGVGGEGGRGRGVVDGRRGAVDEG